MENEVTYKAITKVDLMGLIWKDKGYVYIVKCTTLEGSSRISKATPSSQPLLKVTTCTWSPLTREREQHKATQ